MLFQWPAVTFSERASTTNPFLTKSTKSDDRHVQQIRQKRGRRSYLSVGVGGDSQSLLEREPTRSKERGLLSYNIDECNAGVLYESIFATNMYFKLSFLLFSYDISLETGKTVEKTRRKRCAHERLDEFCFTEHEE